MTNYAESEEFGVTTEAASRTLHYFPCCQDEPWPRVTFKLLLKRKSLHYVMNIIVPSAVTSVVSMTAFIVPHESGERIGLGVACMLVVCAIMFVSGDLLPIASEMTTLSTFYV